MSFLSVQFLYQIYLNNLVPSIQVKFKFDKEHSISHLPDTEYYPSF